MKLKLTIFIIGFVFIISNSFSQKTISTSGGNATGTGGSASYTIGQPFYKSNSSSSASASQGVQQPYEISIINGIDSIISNNIIFKIYPNPTTNNVILNIGNYQINNTNIDIFNISGKLIKKIKITKRITVIPLGILPAGVYITKVFNNNVLLKSYKIVKTK